MTMILIFTNPESLTLLRFRSLYEYYVAHCQLFNVHLK